MKKCTSCSGPIPEGRLKAMPTATTCASCSTEEKWSAGHIIHHKTGNEVCIIKDKEVAKEFHRMSSRAGFGTMRGMKPGVSGGKKSNGLPVGIAVLADKATFEEIGTKAMDMYELFGIDKVRRFLSEKVTERVLAQGQSQRILNVIELLHQKKQPQKKQEKYNPYGKFEPSTPKGYVSKEIEDAFKYWKR